MGQYYKVVNLDKKEYLEPHEFGEGAKLMEFVCGSYGMLSGLALLLASSNGCGGGDLDVHEDWSDIPGRWAGDRIVIAGDYDDVAGSPGCNIYRQCGDSSALEELLKAGGDIKVFTDISHRVLGALFCDEWFRDRFFAVPDGAELSDYLDARHRRTWELARPGETFPRDINPLNSHKSI